MNKTVNINLGGYFFHIDESAYNKLKQYLDAVSRSLNDDPQGKEEIMSDIELRISELLTERKVDDRQVINTTQVDEVIAVMGQPEDYNDDEIREEQPKKNNISKKLFRDADDKFLGGICSGLGHYLGIDSLWVRLIFLALTWGGGIGVLAYIVLWILVPTANTTVEKLEMKGEPVNIDNIERKIREDFDVFKKKVSEGKDTLVNYDYDKLKSQSKSGFQELLDVFVKVLKIIIVVFAKVFGVLLILFSGLGLLAMILSLFSVSSLGILGFSESFVHYPSFFYDSILPKWLLMTFLGLACIIPLLMLFVSGLRILSKNIKLFNTPTKLILLIIWVISIFGLTFTGIEYGVSTASNGLEAQTQEMVVDSISPIKIAFKNNNNLYYGGRQSAEKIIVDGKETKYSNSVYLNVKKSDTENTYVEIIKSSKGKDTFKAEENAEKIMYSYTTTNNNLLFDSYFLSDYKNMYRKERVYVNLYIPEGVTVYFEKSSRRHINDIKNIDRIYDQRMILHHFKMTPKGLKCIDCPSK